MREWIFIGLGGFLGTWCRYGIHLYAKKAFHGAWGTLAVNVLGCFLIGIFLEHPSLERHLPRVIRLALTVGFLGAFTTFSTFGYETMRFLHEDAWGLACLNVVVNLAAGMLAAWLGFRFATLF